MQLLTDEETDGVTSSGETLTDAFVRLSNDAEPNIQLNRRSIIDIFIRRRGWPGGLCGELGTNEFLALTATAS
jgi:hypothetical protein